LTEFSWSILTGHARSHRAASLRRSAPSQDSVSHSTDKLRDEISD